MVKNHEVKLVPCRDCGALVPTSVRGCSMCARNMEAERMIARIILLLGTAALIVCGAIIYAHLTGTTNH